MSNMTIAFRSSEFPEPPLEVASENKENILPASKNNVPLAPVTPIKKKKSGFQAERSGVVKSSRVLSSMKFRALKASPPSSNESLSERVARELQTEIYNELARMLTESPLADISEAFVDSPLQSPSKSTS